MGAQSILEVTNLSKNYGMLQALKDVSFSLEAGRTYGFIGENGAGKTTCIRILAGLTRPDAGNVTAMGHDFPQQASEARRRMGFMVERPIYHDCLTVAQNLKLQMQLYGVKDYDQIPALIERVGLKGVEKRRLKDFSLGMKQRLGIAMTLANKPDLLVLDEPVNGLDPVGMVDVRNILKQLNREGMTIFLSSHILAELYHLATDYIIIHRGQIVRRLALAELNQACRKKLKVVTSDCSILEDAVRTRYPDVQLQRMSSDELHIYSENISGEDIGSIALENQIVLRELSIEGDDLETFYMKTIAAAADARLEAAGDSDGRNSSGPGQNGRGRGSHDSGEHAHCAQTQGDKNA